MFISTTVGCPCLLSSIVVHTDERTSDLLQVSTYRFELHTNKYDNSLNGY